MKNNMSSNIYARIKGHIPGFVKKPILKLLQLYRKIRLAIRKQYVANHIGLMHSELCSLYSTQSPVSVVFVASSIASWKVDSVTHSMMESTFFNVSCIIGRLVNGSGSDVASHEREKLVNHFQRKGYRYIDTFEMDEDEIRRLLADLSPHVVFLTNPHALVKPVLHEEIFMNYLTCYVPYHHEVVSYGDNKEQYDQLSHNAFWKIYSPHHTSKDMYRITRKRGDNGVEVTGLPACESLYNQSSGAEWQWKDPSGNKLRVIWAPHWLIRADLKLATIYELGNEIREIAEKYRDRVEWVMRPHPFLRPTLEQHPEWGKEKTDEFFQFWSDSPFTQIEEGDYVDLFRTSDAMIHDSGSFLAEYLCVDKPVMYLKTENTSENYLNDFGQKALAACVIGRNKDEIESFILSLLDDPEHDNLKRKAFIRDFLDPLYGDSPSTKICSDLLRELNVVTPPGH